MSLPATVAIRAARRAGAVLAMLLLTALAGCSGIVQPFSKSGDAGASGRTPPPVIIRAMTGLPPDKAAILTEALVAAAAKRDVAVVRGDFAGAYTMHGDFQAVRAGAVAAARYRWTLANASGQPVHVIEASEPGRPAPAGDAWAGIDADVLGRIAAYTAESLSTWFLQLGFATRAAGLPPPVDHIVAAGPDAEKDVDYETLYGPYRTGPPEPLAPMEPVPVAGEGRDPPAAASVASSPDEEVDGHRREIRAVAVAEVTGAPGSGNDELAAALRQVLEDAGWPVVAGPADDALAIHGDVAVGDPEGNTQKVALRWTIRMPDGQALGTIEQANAVPAGSLDRGWGDTAYHAALAAADGIFDLVSRLR